MVKYDLVLLTAVELQPSNNFVEVCVGNAVEVNCTTETDRLVWNINGVCRVGLLKQNTGSVGFVIEFCDFEFILLSTSPSLLSSFTMRNVSSTQNGTVVTCVNTYEEEGLRPDQMASISVLVRGNVHHKCVRAHVFAWY